MRVKYISEPDGAVFDTADACRKHEEMSSYRILCGLSQEHIQNALDRKDLALAQAFEKIGAQIAKARREAGETKRRPRGEASAERAPEPLPPKTHAMPHAGEFSLGDIQAELKTFHGDANDGIDVQKALDRLSERRKGATFQSAE